MSHIYNITFAMPNSALVSVVSHFRKELLPKLHDQLNVEFELFRLVEPIADDALSSLCLQIRVAGKEDRDRLISDAVYTECMKDLHDKFGDLVLSFDSFLSPIGGCNEK
ncbi:hypothetical protein [Falsiporphyromonas endometrii]|uniref:Uncharacterized protein n=1 Tax=Falsiporphyromonas endometrii TaxID=1387297 RepID=A0ABV9K5E3_9PORP